MIIPYEQASKKIWKCLHSTEMDVKVRKGTIGFILRSVAESQGREVANSLILKHNLNFHSNGSHNWFDDSETRGTHSALVYPNSLLTEEDRRDATEEENVEMYKLSDDN